MDNAINDLRYEIQFENRVKDKTNFLIKRNIGFLFLKKYILFLVIYFFQILKNCLCISFSAEADTKKHR